MQYLTQLFKFITFSSTDILGEVLQLDLSNVSKSLPLQPNTETVLTIKTVGALRLSDLPDTSLMSPHGDGENKHRATTAVSVLLLTIYKCADLI